MKIKSQTWLILLLLILVITACRADQQKDSDGETVFVPQLSSGTNDQGYPAQDETDPQNDEAYPIQNEPEPDIESAYPISQEDLKLINRNWFLFGYRKNGESLEPVSKTINFYGDAFEMTTDEGTKTGTWSVRINSPIPILVLDTENGDTMIYEVVNLDETNLTIQTAIDQSLIIEEYMPVD
jgi:ABC-type glycerol-3-phosphate transport system substrate-binding protein